MEYNSREIYHVAQCVQSASNSLLGQQAVLSSIISLADSDMSGQAIDQLRNALNGLCKDVGNLTNGLSSIASELRAFALCLEQADQASKYIIQR